MRLIFSLPAERAGVVRALSALHGRLGADVFASAQARGEGFSLAAGIGAPEDLAVSPATGRAEMAAFAFADARPAFGFLSYEYGMHLRGVPVTKETSFPWGCLRKYPAYLFFDGSRGEARVYGDAGLAREIRGLLAAPPEMEPHAPSFSGELRASMSREEYVEGVKRTLEYIRGGYTYQLNLSMQFSVRVEDAHPFALFSDLLRRKPAAHYALFRAGETSVISTSPERFLKVADGEVLSQPIKGTAKAGSNPVAACRALTSSPKEDAELSMIVDLIRNDISGCCEYGSVRVEGHKSVFEVDGLLQMYTNVHGRLRADRSVIDLLLEAFPGGSVTGCPKKSSLAIIDELEPHARGIYCGSLFMIFGERDMDSSIAIRTACLDRKGGFFKFYAGSGIVIDSDPESEYAETLAKAGKFLELTGEGQ